MSLLQQHQNRHKSSPDVRKANCPAFNKKCAKYKLTGHFAKQCKKKASTEHGVLQDRDSVSGSGKLDGFGKISPYTVHKFRNC